MLQTILIFGILCAGSFFYYKYTMQKSKAVIADFNTDEAKKNIKNHTSEILNTQLDYLNNWMDGKAIDAFTDASIPISLKNKAKNAAVDAAKSVAWRVVGVKAKYNRVDAKAHLVLSNNELHFLAANMDGELETHITFSEAQLNAAKIQFKGPKKGADLASGVSDFLSEKLNKEEALVNVFELIFSIDGSEFNVLAHDKMILPYEMGDANYTKNGLIANLIADNFFKLLAEKYPNLTARKTLLVS